MTSNDGQDPQIAALIDRFRKGAMLYHYGKFLADTATELDGLDEERDAVLALDAIGPEMRRVLIPLLDDPDPGVRVCATQFVYPYVPERVVEVLEDLERNCLTEASMTAMLFGFQIKRGDFYRTGTAWTTYKGVDPRLPKIK